MFEWDGMANKLSMKAARTELWLFEPIPSNPENTWRYCVACHDRWANKDLNLQTPVTLLPQPGQRQRM